MRRANMARTQNWRNVRADAIQAGLITEEGLAEARHQHDDEIRAFSLRQIREVTVTSAGGSREPCTFVNHG